MIDTKRWLTEAKEMGLSLPPRGCRRLNIPTAREDIAQVYREFLEQQGRALVWRSEYDRVVDWLADNRGRGLLLHGSCGTGKTFLARYILPAILNARERLIVHTFDAAKLGKQLDTALSKMALVIDDLGTESKYRDYGTLRDPVAELIDNAEKRGVLLIITTNLHLGEGKGSLLEAYDERVIDRLLGLVTAIEFKGDSFRGGGALPL